MGGLDRGDPVAHRLVDRVLQRAAARVHRFHLGAEQAHAEHVQRLALDVDRAHVHHALEPSSAAAVAVATPCWPAPVSATRRCLPMCLRQQRLAEDVVDLVRARCG